MYIYIYLHIYIHFFIYIYIYIYIYTSPPHHREGGGQYHTLTTPHGGDGVWNAGPCCSVEVSHSQANVDAISQTSTGKNNTGTS